MKENPDFPFPHILDHKINNVYILATYATSSRIPLYMNQFYPNWSWTLMPKEKFDQIPERLENDTRP